MTDTRGDAERATLLEFLAAERRLVAWRLEGVSDERVAAVATPSGLTARGIVRHLENVERKWFRQVFAGEDALDFDWSDGDRTAAFRPPADVATPELVASYLAETQSCDAAIAGRSLDETGAREPVTLRWVVLHMIEETSRHLGHLDLLRERADGVVGVAPGWGGG